MIEEKRVMRGIEIDLNSLIYTPTYTHEAMRNDLFIEFALERDQLFKIQAWIRGYTTR